MMIPYTKPSITALEIKYANDAVTNGWGKDCYKYIERFEKMFAEYIGVKYAVATSSCTGAMTLGLNALGIGQGDEVILADTNWIATVSPVVHLGAKPIFADVVKKSWCISPAKTLDAITSKTKAIIATHLYGNLCEIDVLLSLGKIYNIPIIEDAAEAIGSIYFGRKAGSMGRFGVYSFHGTKTLTTGEGGMLVTDDPGLYEDVLTLSNHGRARGQTKQFWPELVGYKFKMSNVQAAIGCAQLERIDDLVNRKQEIMAFYRLHLGGIAGISMNPEPDGCVNGYWMPTLVFDKELGITREMLLDAFRKADIDARVFFHPLSSLPMFTPCWNNYWAYDISQRAINLPSYFDMTTEDQTMVIDVIRRLLK